MAAALLEHETLSGEEIKLIAQVRVVCCVCCVSRLMCVLCVL